MANEQTPQPQSPTVIHVRLEPRSLTRTSAGAIVGPIWLQAGRLAFPEQGWTDFPVAIVGAWLQAALNIHAGREQHAVCHFMDGPFSFTIDALSEAIWQVGFHRTSEKAAEAEFHVHAFGFSGLLAAAAGQLMSACQDRGWSNRDLDVLKALHRQRRSA